MNDHQVKCKNVVFSNIRVDIPSGGKILQEVISCRLLDDYMLNTNTLIAVKEGLES